MNDFLNGSIERYLKELSSRTMVPGGGSASALTAAVGVGLNLMVLNYSIKPDISDQIKNNLDSLIDNQRSSLGKLSSLIDEDCKVFQELMDRLKARESVQGQYCSAAEVPMEICRECFKSIKVSSEIMEVGNKNLITDIGCASNMLRGSFFSAKLNVEINLNYIEDTGFVEGVRNELLSMEGELEEISKEIALKVGKSLKKESSNG